LECSAIASSVGVYGLGRFGAFYSSLLARSYPVKAYTRNPQTAAPDGVERVGEEEVLAQPVLILCVSISALPELLARIGPALQPGTLVMDTCSVKTAPVSWMRESLPRSVEILGTHPMFGPDSARQGLAGLPMILCPVRVDPRRLAHWSGYFSSLGLKVMPMKPEDHDREAAFTQGITHYIGRVLAGLQLRESPIATLGYRKLLEIIEQTCNDSRQLFLDLQVYNPFTREMRARLSESLESIARELDGMEQRKRAAADGSVD
jgi:prephenate dehydrogenase